MNSKDAKVLDILIRSKKPMTSNYLSELLGVSSRTVKRMIWLIDEEINENGAKIISSKNGYEIKIINEEVFERFWSKVKKLRSELNLDNDVVHVILKKLLLNKYYTQDQLVDETYVSRSTINKYIKNVRAILEEQKIILSNRPHFGYYLIGNEVDIRNYMVKLLSNQNDFENIDLQLKESCRAFEAFINELAHLLSKYGFDKQDKRTLSIMKYFIVVAHRNKIKCFLEPYNKGNHTRDIDEQLSKDIHSLLQLYYGINISENETLYLSYIMGNPSNNTVEYDTDFFEEVINDFFSEIQEVYQQDFSYDETLRKNLLQHLYSCYSRMLVNPVIENPMLQIIKTQYVEAYNYSILCGSVLYEKYGLESSEDSLGYIALHFAAALERVNALYKFNAIIVCNFGYGMSELLRARISNRIQNLVIKEVVSSKELYEMDLSDTAIVISTIHLDKKLSRPVITIDPYQLEEDIDSIQGYLKDYANVSLYKKLLSNKRFYPNLNYKNKKDVLDFIATELLNKNLISEENRKEIFAREQMSSTEINSYVAIPHCIVESENETFITVATLKEPISWGKGKISIVFVACIARNSNLNRNLFPLLYKLTMDADKCEKLLSINNYTEFSNLLFSDLPFDYD